MKKSELVMAILGAIAAFSVSAAEIQRYQIELPKEAMLPYQGKFKSDFKHGIPTGLGSGLTFAGKENDGSLLFYSVTDRGPNADAPEWQENQQIHPTKIFMAPSFTPTIMQVRIKDGKAIASHSIRIHDEHGAINGLPLPVGTIGSTSEIALDDHLKPITTQSNRGLDTEGIVPDGQNGFWLCDEYGPFLIHVDLEGKILAKYGPNASENEKSIVGGLPNILKWRQPNRGFEGLARLPSGKIIAAVQSTLDVDHKTAKKASFTRLVSFDPSTGKTAMYAYPLDLSDYKKSNDAKIGDLVAINEQRLLIIEQGKDSHKKMQNRIYMIDLSTATDLTDKQFENKALEYAPSLDDLKPLGIIPVGKSLVLDLKANGWDVQKAEGLTIVDATTLAVASDNDFGLSVKLKSPKGDADSADDYTVNQQGQMMLDDKVVKTEVVIKASKGEESQSQLWLFKLDKPLF